MKPKIEAFSTARDLRLDSLRGLFIVFMTVNHLPTELRVVTDQSLGVFTAAECFVFLSGLIAGLVYTRKLRAGGPGRLHAAAVGRANTIYLWHLASFVVAFGFIQLFEHALGYCAQTAPQLFYEQPRLALLLGIFLLHQPGLLDLLPMYCLFVLLIPVVLRALEGGKLGRVLVTSGLIWLASQWSPPIDGAPIYPINVGTFNLFSWQFLFILGIVIGHARASGLAQVAKPNLGVLLAASALAVYGWGLRHLEWYHPWPDHLYGVLLNKPALGLLRMADFGCIAYLVGVCGSRFPKLFTWRPIAFLGQHSLQIVAAQSVIVMVLLQFAVLSSTATARTLTACAAVAFLFVAAALHRAWQRSRPAAAAVAPIESRQPAGGRMDCPDDIRAA